TPPDFFALATDQTPSGSSSILYDALPSSKYARPDRVPGASSYQVLLPDPSSFSTFGDTARPSARMRSTVFCTPAASHSSNGPSSQLKPKRMARSISLMESHSLAKIVDRLCHLQNWELCLLSWPVLQRSPVQRLPVFAFMCCFNFFVEASASLVPEPFPLQHLLEELRQAQLRPLVADVSLHVVHYVPQHVQPDQINGAEGCRLRPAHGRARERVHLLDAQVQRLHQAHHVEHGERANAIGDEVGRVLRMDDALAQSNVAEVFDGRHRLAVRFRRGDDFQQAHVTRRIEKVRAEPVAAEIVGESFRNRAHRQAAGVGGDDRSRTPRGLHLPQQAALDLEVLD